MTGIDIPDASDDTTRSTRPTLRPRPAGAPRYRATRRDVTHAVVGCAVYVDGRRQEPVAPEDALRMATDRGGFVWLGLYEPTPAEFDAIAARYGLHPLAVEDAVYAHQRPKLERYGDTTFVVLRPARYVDPVEVIKLGELHLFLGPEFAITVRHADEPDLAVVRKCLEDDPELLAHGPYAVLWGVLDRVVDDYQPVLQGLQDDIDQIEEQVFGGDTGVSKRIYQLTREVIAFYRAV
ncbi:MAG: CorA family divalent cation transporter, partial [Blastococcus sp.]